MTGITAFALNVVSSFLSVLFAAVIVYACFCRITKMHSRVFTAVRWSVSLLASVSAVFIYAVLVKGWQPDLAHVAILGAVAAYQIATRRNWMHGIPPLLMRAETWLKH